MAKYVVIEELHLTVSVPADLSDADAKHVTSSLASKVFRSRLLQAVKQLMADLPALAGVRVQISR